MVLTMHQKEQHHFHGLLWEKNGSALYLFEAQKIYKDEILATFHLSINFRITGGLFSAKKNFTQKPKVENIFKKTPSPSSLQTDVY